MAKPTPHEFKPPSDIDDQDGLRFQLPFIQFYPRNPSIKADPVKVIREAIAKALVFYYPLAGRLREHATRKLVVECTGEGIMFIEADADVTLQEFGDDIIPPFPCVEELVYDVPGSGGIINCPLLLIQLTRLKCGGFIFGLRLNHTLCDGHGIVLFLSAISELARGGEDLSVPPVWERHLLNARVPPHVSCTHHAYGDINGNLIPPDDMVCRSFFFGVAEITALRYRLPQRLRRCTTFELLTACLWRCRTIALSHDPNEEVRILCMVNCRNQFNPPLPNGYYGNAFANPVSIASAADLCRNRLQYALELVQKMKSNASEEYVKSMADLMVIRGRPHVAVVRTFIVSDSRRMGFEEVDYGWGKAAYGGPAIGDIDVYTRVASFYVPYKNNKGEKGILVSFCLPSNVMEVFMKELRMMVNKDYCDNSLP